MSKHAVLAAAVAASRAPAVSSTSQENSASMSSINMAMIASSSTRRTWLLTSVCWVICDATVRYHHVAPPGPRLQRRRKHVRVTHAADHMMVIHGCDDGAGSRNRTDTPVKEQVFETCASTNSAMPARPLAIAARLAFANMPVRRYVGPPYDRQSGVSAASPMRPARPAAIWS